MKYQHNYKKINQHMKYLPRLIKIQITYWVKIFQTVFNKKIQANIIKNNKNFNHLVLK
jgi:hypothetical protein